LHVGGGKVRSIHQEEVDCSCFLSLNTVDTAAEAPVQFGKTCSSEDVNTNGWCCNRLRTHSPICPSHDRNRFRLVSWVGCVTSPKRLNRRGESAKEEEEVEEREGDDGATFRHSTRWDNTASIHTAQQTRTSVHGRRDCSIGGGRMLLQGRNQGFQILLSRFLARMACGKGGTASGETTKHSDRQNNGWKQSNTYRMYIGLSSYLWQYRLDGS
jgi:hypothetical protein